MTCNICGGMCLDPHVEEYDPDGVLDSIDPCPFHGSECVAIEIRRDKWREWAVYDCGANSPHASKAGDVVKEANKRGAVK